MPNRIWKCWAAVKILPGQRRVAEAPAGGRTCRCQWRRTAAQTYLEELRCPPLPLAFLKMRSTLYFCQDGKREKVVCLQQRATGRSPCPCRGGTISTILWQPLPPPVPAGYRQGNQKGSGRSGWQDAFGKIIMPAGYNVINDSYNASPTSVAAALDV